MRRHQADMLSLLLLLLVGATIAQESGDFAQEDSNLLGNAAKDEDEKFEGSFDDAYNEEENDERDLFQSQESDNIEPDFTKKAVGDVCPNKGTCGYHVFSTPMPFFKAQCICRKKGGNLSSIHGCSTNNYLRGYLRRSCRNANYVWIGVWKRNRCFPYQNVDRSRLDYTNWGCRPHHGHGQWCTAINTCTGKWWSLRCHTRLPFVCTY